MAKFAFAILAGAVVVAPAALAAEDAADTSPPAAQDKAAAADDCLTAPNGAAPQGEHWFYRTERGSQRRCWYLHDKPERQSQPVATTAPATSKPTARAAEAPVPRVAMPTRQSADARAELQASRRSQFETDGVARTQVTPQVAPQASQSTLTSADKAAINGGNEDPGSGSRDMDASASPQPLDTFSAAPPAPDPAPAASDDAGTDANASLTTAPAAEPVLAPDTPAAPQAAPRKTSLQKLLMVIFGALAFAGLTGSLMHRLACVWRKRRARLRRHTLWQSANPARSRSALTRQAEDFAAAPARADAANQPNDTRQIEELLGLIAKRAKRDALAAVPAKSRAGAAVRGQRSSARRGARA